MSTITEWIAALFAGTLGLLNLAIALLLIIAFFVGLYAAFVAAWWMGIICLIFPPAATVNGLIYIGTWGAVNLAAKLVALIIGGKVATLAITAVG